MSESRPDANKGPGSITSVRVVLACERDPVCPPPGVAGAFALTCLRKSAYWVLDGRVAFDYITSECAAANVPE